MTTKEEKIEQIVKDHKCGELSYNAGLEILEKMGLKQIDAHNLLFPPFPSEDDWDIVLPQNLEGLNIDG
jgi:hypothetical protein